MRVVIDTNIILASLHPRSKYGMIINYLLSGKYEIAISQNILTEYEEKITENFDLKSSEIFTEAILNVPSVIKINPYFNFELITHDADDNKFVDCAFAANANYIITNDKHFNVLKNISFPKITVVTLEEFLEILSKL